MKHISRNVFVAAAIVAGGVILVAIGASRRSRHLRPHSVAEIDSANVAMSDELGRFVAVLNGVESEDDKRYQAALERLRGSSADIIGEARQLLGAGSGSLGDDLALRHSVVLAVAALRDPGALDFLSEVALNPQPLPPVDSPLVRGLFDTHPEHRLDAEAVVQRTIVALEAVDGVEALAIDGSAAALDALVAVSAGPLNAVRAAGLTALGARPEWREHRDRAIADLPDDLRHLAYLSRKAVTDVPQIRDPRVTLRGAGNATTRAPGLNDDSDLRRTPVAGAPRAGGR